MKTETQLKAKIDAMDIEELRLFAADVVITLYGKFTDEDGFELPEMLLDPDKEWDASYVSDVAGDVENAGLHPDSL